MDNGTVRLILQDDVLTAVLSGEIDHHTAQGMREEIDFTVNQSKPKKLILSFEHVGFMDSAVGKLAKIEKGETNDEANE